MYLGRIPITPPSYVKRIVDARYFWWHLALADIRNKYRRSVMGILWAILQPLGMTLLLATVLGRLFNQPLSLYAPYVFLGIIVWDYTTNAMIGGCRSFFNAQMYIKQCTHPYVIYTLRHALAGAINFCLALLGMVLWALFFMGTSSFSWLLLPISCVILFMILWSACTLCAFITTWFHDFSQIVVLVLQALYFVSPIFFTPESFHYADIGYLVDYNPVYHVLELFRAPILNGTIPTVANYLVSIGTLAFAAALNAALIYRSERNLIFYL